MKPGGRAARGHIDSDMTLVHVRPQLITAPAINNPTARRSFFWRLFQTRKPVTSNAIVRPPIITPSAI